MDWMLAPAGIQTADCRFSGMRVDLLKLIRVHNGRIQKWIRLPLLYALMASGWTSFTASAASFSATLEPKTVAVGDTATLKLLFEGSGQIQLSPLPNIPGLVVSGPEKGRSINIVNGRRTETVSATYYLRPVRTNVFQIPSLQARIGSESFQSQPLQLTAVKATQTTAGQALAVLRLVIPRDRIYLGETMVVELQLLLRGNASAPSQFTMPDFSSSGWLAGQPMQAQKRRAQYGGGVATVFPIQIPITPLKAGKLSIGPVESSVMVQVPAPARRNDPFGGFGFFQQTESRRVPLSLPAHEIEVLPLPAEGEPAGFAGAIGEFNMSVTAGPTNVTVGDPITLRVQIEGHGNMSSITFPDSLVQGDFKTYDAEIKLDTTDDFGLAGVKTVEQIVIPQNTEVQELPSVDFSFFDPEAGAYRTLHHPAIPLIVKPAGSRPAPVLAASTGSNSEPPSQQDIVHIMQRIGPAAEPDNTSTAVRLVTWNSVPLLAWLGVVVWRKRKEMVERDPRLRRRQAVQHGLDQGFKDLRHFAESGKSDEFFATLFRMMQEQIGLVLDVPATGITEAVIEEKLVANGVSQITLGKLQELFQACNAARYAPTRDTQELAAFIPKLTQTLRELEDLT